VYTVEQIIGLLAVPYAFIDVFKGIGSAHHVLIYLCQIQVSVTGSNKVMLFFINGYTAKELIDGRCVFSLQPVIGGLVGFRPCLAPAIREFFCQLNSQRGIIVNGIFTGFVVSGSKAIEQFDLIGIVVLNSQQFFETILFFQAVLGMRRWKTTIRQKNGYYPQVCLVTNQAERVCFTNVKEMEKYVWLNYNPLY
jgi:hypothetical protein